MYKKRISCYILKWIQIRIIFIINMLNDGVKRAFEIKNTTMGNMGITFCGSNRGMPKKFLDVAYVCAVFQQMCSKSMAQAVDRRSFVDAGTA